MTAPLLSAENLGIMRGARVLFREISIDVVPGQAVILRGPNGSGKTTLLRILAGLTQPEAGRVERFSTHHWLGHRDSVKPDETAEGHLKRWAKAWGAAWPMASDFDLETLINAPSDIPSYLLSAGQRRRTALARLRLQHRSLWLLDEPFTALDKNGRVMLLDQIESHRKNGGAIIAAIHGSAGFAASTEVEL